MTLRPNLKQRHNFKMLPTLLYPLVKVKLSTLLQEKSI